MFGANIEGMLLRESAYSSSSTVDHLARSEQGEAEHTLMNLKRMLQKKNMSLQKEEDSTMLSVMLHSFIYVNFGV